MTLPSELQFYLNLGDLLKFEKDNGRIICVMVLRWWQQTIHLPNLHNESTPPNPFQFKSPETFRVLHVSVRHSLETSPSTATGRGVAWWWHRLYQIAFSFFLLRKVGTKNTGNWKWPWRAEKAVSEMGRVSWPSTPRSHQMYTNIPRSRHFYTNTQGELYLCPN